MSYGRIGYSDTIEITTVTVGLCYTMPSCLLCHTSTRLSLLLTSINQYAILLYGSDSTVGYRMPYYCMPTFDFFSRIFPYQLTELNACHLQKACLLCLLLFQLCNSNTIIKFGAKPRDFFSNVAIYISN